MRYVDPTGHWSFSSIGSSISNAISSIGSAISSIGDTISKIGNKLGNVHLVGSILKGAGNIIGGTVKSAGGIVSGDLKTIGNGISTIAKGATNIGTYIAKDLGGAALGNLSHLYTFPRDLKNLGKSIISLDLKDIAAKTRDLVMGALVIRNGFYTGAGHGKDKNTLGNASTSYFSFDPSSKLHDSRKLTEFGWIKGVWKERGVGPYGQAVRAIGTVGFGIYGVLTGQKW